jgi:opacity protein-like surface antigen
MRKFVSFSLLALVLSVAVAAQAEPKAEIFGGYQYTHLDGGTNMNGWNGALTGNFNEFLGIRADLSGGYKSGLKFYTYTFGPELSLRLPVLKPFAHVLAGGARASSGGVSNNGFDLMIGGGVDTGTGLIAWRMAQFDWMMTRFNGFTDKKNVRISTGLVLRF